MFPVGGLAVKGGDGKNMTLPDSTIKDCVTIWLIGGKPGELYAPFILIS